MKLRKYLTYAAIVCFAATVLPACDGNEDVPYEPAPSVSGERIYFATGTVTAEVDDNVYSYSVPIYRPESLKDKEYTVQLLAQDESSLFHVPATVTFAAGETETMVEITFDSNTIPAGKTYPVTITVDEGQANQYGISTVTVNFIHASWSEWTEFGKGYYVFSLYYSGTQENVKVMERHLANDDQVMQYQFQWPVDNDNPDAGYETFLTAETDNGGKVISVPTQPFAEDPEYGTVYVSGIYNLSGDPADEDKSGFDSTTGLFTLNLIYHLEDGNYFAMGDEYCQLEGYADTDVSEVKLHDNGLFNIDRRNFSIISVLTNENEDVVRNPAFTPNR